MAAAGNLYFLRQVITGQRLLDRAMWRTLFDQAGLEAVALAHPDPTVESTALTLGFPVRPNLRCALPTHCAFPTR
ncbi:hypothetical protein [Frankia tisae]|uniref:hypothetical protein n=1 Tax=Frankia tisae TaxID=2950104 RepID=UPI0021BE00CD|nr:hypothetical protein [Frankia tisae]